MEVLAELHMHTTVSDGRMTPEEAVRLARHRRLAAIAVTDHDSFRGSVLAARISRLLGGPVIVYGNEVRTEYGDVLVYCRDPLEAAPGLLEPLRDWAVENNCILVAAHPFHPVRSSIGPRIFGLLDYFDAIEVWNSRGLPWFNTPALLLAMRRGVPGTSGSDAHVEQEVATSPVALPEYPESAGDVVDWIAEGRIEPRPGLPRLSALPHILAWALERRLTGGR